MDRDRHDDGDRTRPRTEPSDRGSAVAEFALVSALLSFVLLAVLQLALAIHVRNTLVAAAADGARVAAARGHTLDEGVARARELASAALSPAYAEGVSARRTTVGGAPAVAVEVRAPLPLLGLVGPAGDLSVEAHALLEEP